MRALLLPLCLMFLTSPLLARPVDSSSTTPIVADLSIRSIDIDHNFSGLDILLFGARSDVGRVVIVIRGPEREYTVRRKEKVGGIWVNRDMIRFRNVPSYYALASVADLSAIRNDALLQQLQIGSEDLPFQVVNHNFDASPMEIAAFEQALREYKQQQGLYRTEPARISFWGETLFRTVLKFPKNIPGGWYTAEIYLFNDGLLSAVQTTPIHVKKIGFEEFMFNLAHDHALIYGLLSVVMALVAGWGGSAIFGRV